MSFPCEYSGWPPAPAFFYRHVEIHTGFFYLVNIPAIPIFGNLSRHYHKSAALFPVKNPKGGHSDSLRLNMQNLHVVNGRQFISIHQFMSRDDRAPLLHGSGIFYTPALPRCLHFLTNCYWNNTNCCLPARGALKLFLHYIKWVWHIYPNKQRSGVVCSLTFRHFWLSLLPRCCFRICKSTWHLPQFNKKLLEKIPS